MYHRPMLRQLTLSIFCYLPFFFKFASNIYYHLCMYNTGGTPEGDTRKVNILLGTSLYNMYHIYHICMECKKDQWSSTTTYVHYTKKRKYYKRVNIFHYYYYSSNVPTFRRNSASNAGSKI